MIYFGLCWNLRLVIRVIIINLEGFWFLWECFFLRLYFCIVKYLSFHKSSFCLKIHSNVNGKAIMWHTPRLFVLYHLFASFVCLIEISQAMVTFVVVMLLVLLESSQTMATFVIVVLLISLESSWRVKECTKLVL